MGCKESKTRPAEQEVNAAQPSQPEPQPEVAAAPVAAAAVQLTYRSSKQLLGKGASASVYVGVCEQTLLPVAIKRVVVNDPAKQIALKNEFDTLRKLPRHPNVVQVEHFEVIGQDGIIVLELVRGGTLRRLCNAAPQKRLHESVIRWYMRDALLGLRHLHRHSVIHRDVKCDNVLVAQKLFPGFPAPFFADGRSVTGTSSEPLVKITDFGSCKDTLHGGVCQTTVNVVGTVPYMSPEAIKGKFSEASDVWAWAITFVELATTGQQVWAHLGTRDAFQLLLKIGTLPPAKCKPPIPEQLSEAAKDMLRLCLSYNASARPSCDALLQSPYFSGDLSTPPDDIESLEAYESVPTS